MNNKLTAFIEEQLEDSSSPFQKDDIPELLPKHISWYKRNVEKAITWDTLVKRFARVYNTSYNCANGLLNQIEMKL
jgi:hypothetical protein